MKNQWMAYVIVAVISALAGVAIAGPPNTVGTDATIIVPETTSTTTPALEPVEPVEPTTTVAAPEPDEPPTSEATDNGETADTTTTTEAPASTTTTTEGAPMAAPAEVVVVSINGAGTAGLATRVRNELRDAGYDLARATDGTRLVDETVIYYYPTYEREAVKVAETLGYIFPEVLPVDQAPEFGQLEGDHVAVYLGRDRS